MHTAVSTMQAAKKHSSCPVQQIAAPSQARHSETCSTRVLRRLDIDFVSHTLRIHPPQTFEQNDAFIHEDDRSETT